MKLLFVGDIVGSAGCDFFASNIYKIKKDHSIDITVVNGENSADGNGISPTSAYYLLGHGADVITTGNHSFKRRDAIGIYEKDVILRPANYPDGVVGKGVCTLDFGRFSVAVVNLQGVTYMDALDNPFSCIDYILGDIPTPNIIVDFHAEATAEKKAMGHYLTGKVTAVLGTHTHVQTADEIILGSHTAYITDVGMTGPELSVLGVKTESAVDKLRFRFPVMFSESENPCFMNAVVVEFDEKNGKAKNIERLILR